MGGGVLDTLTILIEADSSGLTTQLKTATNTITSFVSKMNDQTVDWTKILASTISPAIISGIASTFAIAITSALGFQQALTTSTADTNQTVTGNVGEMTSGILGISDQTGQTATDIATAMAIVGQAFGTGATGIGIMSDLSTIATQRGMSLSTVVSTLVPLLQQWGVTTLPQANTALATLNQSTTLGTIGFSDLVNALTQSGAALKNNISLSDAATQLEAISATSKASAATVIGQFNAIAQGVQNPLAQIDILSGGVGKLTTALNTNGLIGDFEAIGEAIQKFPIAAQQTLGQQMGLTGDQVQGFANTSVSAYATAGNAASKFSANGVQPLSTQLQNTTTDIDILKEGWATFVNALNATVGSPFLTTLGTDLGELGNLIKNPQQEFNTSGTGAIEDLTSNSSLGSKLKDLFTLAISSFGSGLTKFFSQGASPSTNQATGNQPTPTSGQASIWNNTVNVNVTTGSGNPGAIGTSVKNNISTLLNNSFYGTQH